MNTVHSLTYTIQNLISMGENYFKNFTIDISIHHKPKIQVFYLNDLNKIPGEMQITKRNSKKAPFQAEKIYEGTKFIYILDPKEFTLTYLQDEFVENG